MRKTFAFLAAVILTTSVFAQSPEKMSYQAVVRDGSNYLVTGQTVGMQISILKGSANGTAVYVEMQTPTTNANGLVSVEIGNGIIISDDFSAIDWESGSYFIKTEIDLVGGINYTITSTSQLLSVPYALHAKTADTFTGTIIETDPIFTSWDKSTGISLAESQISNLDHFTTIDETDPVYSSSVAIGITATDTINWNNKLDSYTETDPIFTSWDKSTGISLAESQISDLDHFTTFDETDPVYSSSVASGITATDTTNWNNKIDSYTETDPTFTNSEAANLTATDIMNLSNLSGTNTGNQDISGIATNTQAIKDTASQIRADIHTIKTYSVGDFAHGGIVFWVDETGQHGLVAAKVDQSAGVRWYAGTYGNTQAKGDGSYAGKANTSIIITAQVAIGDDGNTYAARICNELKVTEGGKTYGDWYLPSREELNMMYQNKSAIDATAEANGGNAFANRRYWSSTEDDINFAWEQNFTNGFDLIYSKDYTHMVRAVRAF